MLFNCHMPKSVTLKQITCVNFGRYIVEIIIPPIGYNHRCLFFEYI